MKTLLLYYSKTGFTQKYAKWLAEKIPCDFIPFENKKILDFNSYDTIIFASWLHAGTIQKLGWLKKQFSNSDFSNKNRIILITGAAPADREETITAIQNNFKEDSHLYKIFYLPSGLCYEKMGFVDKWMMKVFHQMMKKKTPKTDYEQMMSNTLRHSFDNSKKDYLKPVIDYIQTL